MQNSFYEYTAGVPSFSLISRTLLKTGFWGSFTTTIRVPCPFKIFQIFFILIHQSRCWHLVHPPPRRLVPETVQRSCLVPALPAEKKAPSKPVRNCRRWWPGPFLPHLRVELSLILDTGSNSHQNGGGGWCGLNVRAPRCLKETQTGECWVASWEHSLIK